jgi:hypothetical protein
MTKKQQLKPPHAMKANVEVGVVWLVGVASGAPRVGGVGVPVAAPQHTEKARRYRSGWVLSRWLTIRRPIPIPTPRKHIPSHIVESITVRRKRPHRTRVRKPSSVEVCVVAVRSQIVVTA